MDTNKLKELITDVCNRWNIEPYFRGYVMDQPYNQATIEWLDKNITRPATILEFGCGISQHGIVLTNLGFQYTGADIVENRLEAGKELIKQNKYNAIIIKGNALSDKIGEFDVVMPCNFSYEPSIDIDRLFENCNNNLKPGGYLIIDIMEPDKPTYTDNPGTSWERYVHKYSQVMINDLMIRHHFKLITRIRNWTFPRAIYIGRKIA